MTRHNQKFVAGCTIGIIQISGVAVVHKSLVNLRKSQIILIFDSSLIHHKNEFKIFSCRKNLKLFLALTLRAPKKYSKTSRHKTIYK